MRNTNTKYQIAVFLSSLSMVFGILREFLIVGLIGFTAVNDELQLYLSVFYTIGLSIDAMRLSCLNLYARLSLAKIIYISSLISLPFATMIGLSMGYFSGFLNLPLLFVGIIGGYLNLIATLLITYKQRCNFFLSAQLINVMPNILLIPTILIIYCFALKNFVSLIICVTASIPVIQCTLLFLLPNHKVELIKEKELPLTAGLMILLRHFLTTIGEQLFQIITRTAFYQYSVGYLSIFSMLMRIYSAGRFIFIDTLIGAKLANWQKESDASEGFLKRLINSTFISIIIVSMTLFVSLETDKHLIIAAAQIIFILLLGFYFSTLIRIIYFKINQYESNTKIVLQFTFFELTSAFIAFLMTKQLHYSLLSLLWIGYIAKPFLQILLLKKQYLALEIRG